MEPIPEGRSQFILAYTEGKTRPILQLYDTGCGGILFKEGVLEKEIDAIRKVPGPFYVNGVGDSTIQVNDEWFTSLQLIDGTRVSVEGSSVKENTASFPMTNISVAQREIKANMPSNKELQKLNCSPCIGGDINILIGMLYLKYFPKAVHSLPNGLTIYSLRVKSHDGKINAALGGPHSSFHQLGAHYGSMSVVFANLSKQLENFRSYGPPSIQRSLISSEEVRFLQELKPMEFFDINSNESEFLFQNPEKLSCEGDVFDGNTVLDVTEIPEESLGNAAEEDYFSTGLDVVDHCTISCNECGRQVMALVKNEDDESISALKRLQQAQQEGLDVSYRCLKCRDCTACKRSHDTERLSLREEAEDM